MMNNVEEVKDLEMPKVIKKAEKVVKKVEPIVREPKTFTLGQRIKLKPDAVYHNGKSIPFWVISQPLYYRGTNEYGIVFGTQKTGAVAGIVEESNIL